MWMREPHKEWRGQAVKKKRILRKLILYAQRGAVVVGILAGFSIAGTIGGIDSDTISLLKGTLMLIVEAAVMGCSYSCYWFMEDALSWEYRRWLKEGEYNDKREMEKSCCRNAGTY